MEEAQHILTALTPIEPSTKAAARAYDASIRQHIALLNSTTSEICPVILGATKETLESLDPSLHSISYLFVLHTLTDSVESGIQIPLKLLLDKIVDFLLSFDPIQIRYAGQPLLVLLEKVGSGKLFPPLAAVELLSAAIMRINPTGSVFTSTHFMVARLAYNSNTVESALRVIDRDILFYPNSINTKEKTVLCDPSLPPASFISTQTGLTDRITTTMVLEYNYVRGLMYMSRRDWNKAEEAFEHVISHPIKDRVVSKIMVDSYKRWVLAALLGQGKASTIPSYTSATAQASFKIVAKAYIDVAEALRFREAQKLKLLIQECASVWEEDGTSSLLQEVLSSYQKWEIVDLRHIYERVDISLVREVVVNGETGEKLEDDDAVLAVIRQMIEDGMLNGQIEQDDSGACYVFFWPDKGAGTEEEFAAQIAQSYHNVESISKRYKQMNDQLSSSKEYVKYLAREQKRAEKDDAQAGMGFDPHIEDDDLMSGIVAHS